VKLTGKLKPWVSAKDVILELLRRYTVSGGIGKIYEYGGPGLAELNVPQRSTIANMGAELGLTSTVFPSDEQTKRFLKAQKREKNFISLTADSESDYDEVIELNLSDLEPLVARPHSPDNVVPVQEIAGTPLRQVTVGSSVNSSFMDLMTVAKIIEGKKVDSRLHMTISPGSRQVLVMATQAGGMSALFRAGVRGLEVACGPCIGMGMAPPSGGNSLRTFNRNFPGRSGTADDRVYLCSPEIAAASAIAGEIADPRKLGNPPKVEMPEEFYIDDSGFLPPSDDPSKVEVVRGPNIQPLPKAPSPADTLQGPVLIKLKDNISTDEILPAGARILPLRSNIPAIAEYVFYYIDKTFPARAKQKGPGFIVARKNYGQGSSREHAAIAPMYLGVRAVIAVTFARIHQDNLVNFGILPLRFVEPEKYDSIDQDDQLVISGILDGLRNAKNIKLRNQTKNFETELTYELTSRQKQILLNGGLAGILKGRNR
jgi:aconitate hydratase